MGRQYQKALRASERRVGHSNVGPGKAQGTRRLEGGGNVNSKGHGWRPSKPRCLINLGKGPSAPMPKAARRGQRGGVDGDEERPYTHEKPVCDGVPSIAMPVCPKARCRVKLVKGHRGRGVP